VYQLLLSPVSEAAAAWAVAASVTNEREARIFGRLISTARPDRDYSALIRFNRRSALKALRSRLERSFRGCFAVTFRSGHGIGFVVFRSVRGVARVGFRVEV
jgi:hypothetical protein